MKSQVIIIVLMLVPVLAMAQPDFSQLAKEKMALLDHMVGTWKGTGYAYTPQGKESSDVTEVIQYKLDKTVLFVEGKGIKTMEDGTQKVVHDALGIISFHPFTKKYYMNSFISKGMSTKADLKIEDNRIIWWFETGPNTIRYTLTIADGQWVEIGERSTDGENWQQFFEMKLKKTS